MELNFTPPSSSNNSGTSGLNFTPPSASSPTPAPAPSTNGITPGASADNPVVTSGQINLDPPAPPLSLTITPTTNANGEIQVNPSDVSNVAKSAEGSAPQTTQAPETGYKAFSDKFDTEATSAWLGFLGGVSSTGAKIVHSLGEVPLNYEYSLINKLTGKGKQVDPNVFNKYQNAATALQDTAQKLQPYASNGNATGGKTAFSLGSDIGSMTAQLPAFEAGGELAEATKIPSLFGKLVSDVPVIGKYLDPIVQNGLRNMGAFSLANQPIAQNHWDQFKSDVVNSLGFSITGSIPDQQIVGKLFGISATAGLGYGLARLSGKNQQDSIASGVLMGALHGFNVIGDKNYVEVQNDLKKEAIDSINQFSTTKVDENSTPEELKQAYREAIKVTHPDVGGKTEDAAKVNNAYSFLQKGGFDNVPVPKTEPEAQNPEVQKALAEIDVPGLEKNAPVVSATPSEINLKPEDIQAVADRVNTEEKPSDVPGFIRKRIFTGNEEKTIQGEGFDMKTEGDLKTTAKKPTVGEGIIVGRHGDIPAVDDNIAHGQKENADTKLTPEGRSDAKKLGQEWKNQGITHIVSSDLKRGSETAKIASQEAGATTETDPALRTWDIGKFDGKPKSEVEPELEYYRSHPNEIPPGGESYGAFRDRIVEGLKTQEKKQDISKTAFVLHNEILKSLGHKFDTGETGQIKIPNKKEIGHKNAEEFAKSKINAYHQSQSKNTFTEFRQKGDVGYKKASYSEAGEGIYFSPNKEAIINKYGSDGGQLIEVALDMKNPLDLGPYDAMYFDGRKVHYSDIVSKNFKKTLKGEEEDPEPDILITNVSKKAKSWILKNGYDGIEGMKSEMYSAPEYVVFDKSLIKTKDQLMDLFNQKPIEEKPIEKKEPKTQKFTDADAHGGFIDPSGVVKGIKTKVQEVSNFISETQKNSKISGDLALSLDNLRKGRTADELALIEFLNKNAESQELNQNEKENIINHVEDKTQVLTPREEQVYKNVVQPLLDASKLMLKQMKEWGMNVPSLNENYIKHEPINKKTSTSKLLKNAANNIKSATGGKNILSKTVNTKDRVFKSITDEDGNRTVVAVKDGRVTSFKNGVAQDLGSLKLKTLESLRSKEIKPLEKKITDIQKTISTLESIKTREPVSQTKIKNLEDKALAMTADLFDTANTRDLDPDIQKVLDTKTNLKLQGLLHDIQLLRGVKTADEVVLRDQRIATLQKNLVNLVNSISDVESKYDPENLDQRVFVGKDGKNYTLGNATIKEIEANTDQRYYKEPVVTAALSYTENLMAYNAAKWFQAWKESPEFENVAIKESEVSPDEIPKTWKTTNLKQFTGYYFEPRVAEVLDDFNQALTGNKNVALNILNQFNGFILKLTLLNPIAHGLNTTANAITERNLNLLKPSFIRGLTKAYSDITSFNENYRTMLREGAPLMRASGSAQALGDTILKQFTKPAMQDKNLAEAVHSSFGEAGTKAMDTIKNIPKALHGAAFFIGDLLMSASIYQEAETKGISYEDAIKNITKYQADYRMPSRIGDQLFTGLLGEEKGGEIAHGIAQLLKNNTVFAFSGYHISGIIKPWFNAVKDTIDPKANKEDRIKGISVIIMGALIYLAIQEIQKKLQEITKNPNLYVKAPGMIGAMTDVVSLLEGHENAIEFISKFLTPAPGSKAILEMIPGINKDFYTGNPIFGVGHEPFFSGFLGSLFSSETAIGKAAGSTENFRDYVLSLLGIHSPGSTINTPIQKNIMKLAQAYQIGEYAASGETDAQKLLGSIRSNWQKGNIDAVRQNLITAQQSGDLKTIGNGGLNFKTATQEQLQQYFHDNESDFKADIPVDVRDFSSLPADPQKLLLDQMTYPELLKYGWYVTSKKSMTGTAAEEEFAKAANAGKIKPPTWVRGQISTADQEAYAKEGKKPSFPSDMVTSNGGIIKTVVTYAKAIAVDPKSAFDDIFHGQAITKVDNGTVFVQRMPESTSQADKLELLQEAQKKGLGMGKTISEYTLDHVSSLELGGNNEIRNLQLIDINQAKQDDQVENYLGKAVKAGIITRKQAQEYEMQYKKGADMPYTLNPEVFNKVDKTLTLQELQNLVGGAIPTDSGGDQNSNDS